VPQLSRSLERAIHSIDPSAPFSDVHPMTELVSNAGIHLRFILLLLAVGATATLTLGVVGLYGVVAYVVGFRAREISIRIALGLQPNRAVAMIVRQGTVVVAVGAVVGLIAFIAFAKLLRAVAFDVSVVDVTSLSFATAVVIAISMMATWAPARRAGHIDPAEALKTD
jgi:ABC-type antimicrobial peptide transport system permease subunit